MIVEWSSVDRTKLEALFKQGVVPVRYNGCEMQVLSDCSAPGNYNFVATTPKKDLVHIRNADELFANLPVGAAELEGKLAQSEELQVSMSIVGRYQSSRSGVRQGELQGTCSTATHVISGLIVGAFEFGAVRKSSAAVKASAFGVGAGVGTDRDRDVLSKDGDLASCESSTATSSEPPEKCRALLRVEVTPLPEAQARIARETAEREEQERQRERERNSRANARIAGYVLMGTGVVAGISGYLLYRAADSSYDSVDKGGLATSNEIQGRLDDGNRFRVIGWTAIGLGGASLLTGAPVWFFNREPSAGSPAAVHGASLVPTLRGAW